MTQKKIVIIVAFILSVGLLVGAYFYWSGLKKTKTEPAPQAASPEEKITENATKGTLPSIQTNPLESKPDLNPADKANPFTNIKTNPFK